jgi:CubicO group peptidase (beta-lactamase class C family)
MQDNKNHRMKKLIKYIGIGLLTIVVAFSAYALISGKTYLFTAVYHNFANIDDYKIFENNVVKTDSIQPFDISKNYGHVTLPAGLNSSLESSGSIAIAVIKNDSLVFEKYWDGYNDSSYSGSFSVAKTITAMLIGVALKEGKIKSLHDKVGDYLPEFKEGDKAAVKIIDLLTMSSGSNWDEAYANPFSVTTEAYYGDDVYKTATGVKITRKPGTYFEYKSGDTQLLGLILQKATGKSLSEYASEKLWKPLGASHPAYWSTDKKNGNEKAYCCFNSNARDFAKIGVLLLHQGNWKGKQIIDSSFCEQAVRPCMISNEGGVPCNYYGYQLWILPDRPRIYFARGILGQYIVVDPEKNMVIVRLGKTVGPRSQNGFPKLVYSLLDWGEKL